MFVEIIVEFLFSDGKKVEERFFHFLKKAEEPVAIAVQKKILHQATAGCRDIIDEHLKGNIQIQTVLQCKDAISCQVAAVRGHDGYIQRQPDSCNSYL